MANCQNNRNSTMQQFISELYNSLVEATSECKTNYLSLSGGLDSTIIAYLLREKIHGVSVIVSDYSAPDNLSLIHI